MSERFKHFRGVGYTESAEDWRRSYHEPGTVRVCPERDARCPHGPDCPYWIDRGSCDMAASRAALAAQQVRE